MYAHFVLYVHIFLFYIYVLYIVNFCVIYNVKQIQNL